MLLHQKYEYERERERERERELKANKMTKSK